MMLTRSSIALVVAVAVPALAGRLVTVTRVIDGDTIDVNIDGEVTRHKDPFSNSTSTGWPG